MKREVVEVSKLREHPKNYRAHPPDQVDHLAESIRANGLYRNIVIAEDDTILAGHGVVKAVMRLGMTEVPVYRLPVPPNHPKALRVLASDNEVSRMCEDNEVGLLGVLEELDGDLLGTGYDDMMLSNFATVIHDEQKEDPRAHWVGMPEYEDGENYYKIALDFPTEEARQEFVTRAGLRARMITTTWTARWPYERNDFASVKFRAS